MLLERKKPYPDVYIEALSEMQASPEQAIAIEGSAVGLQAATSAGIAYVVCSDAFVAHSSSGYVDAALVVPSLADLNLRVLERLQRGQSAG